MKYTSLLILATLTTTSFAQSTPAGAATNVSPPSTPGTIGTSVSPPSTPPTNISPPTGRLGYAQPVVPGEVPQGSPADGTIVTPGSLRQNEEDDLFIRQSGRNQQVLTPQEEQFQERIQGQPPRAIPSQGIGIPDPLNPNPNVPNTTPTPLPKR